MPITTVRVDDRELYVGPGKVTLEVQEDPPITLLFPRSSVVYNSTGLPLLRTGVVRVPNAWEWFLDELGHPMYNISHNRLRPLEILIPLSLKGWQESDTYSPRRP